MSVRGGVIERVALVAVAAWAGGATAAFAAPPAPPFVPQAPVHVAARLAPAAVAPQRSPLVRGSFEATLQRLPQGGLLSWKLALTGARGGVSAQIRLGRAGEGGPPLLQLCSRCARRLARTTFLPPQLVERVLRGGATVTIATRQQPLGVARGQIEVLR